MIDLTEMNIMFTLNGEMLISDSGSEMAFKDIDIGEGKQNNKRGLEVLDAVYGQNYSDTSSFKICEVNIKWR